jgi:hypothetical protein
LFFMIRSHLSAPCSYEACHGLAALMNLPTQSENHVVDRELCLPLLS